MSGKDTNFTAEWPTPQEAMTQLKTNNTQQESSKAQECQNQSPALEVTDISFLQPSVVSPQYNSGNFGGASQSTSKDYCDMELPEPNPNIHIWSQTLKEDTDVAQELHPSVLSQLKPCETERDHNCLYNAVCLCLGLSESYQNVVREKTAQCIRTHANHFAELLEKASDEKTVETLISQCCQPDQVEGWGDTFYLLALAIMLRRNVIVYQTFRTPEGQFYQRKNKNIVGLAAEFSQGGEKIMQHQNFEPQIGITSQNPIFLYLTGSHFTALVPRMPNPIHCIPPATNLPSIPDNGIQATPVQPPLKRTRKARWLASKSPSELAEHKEREKARRRARYIKEKEEVTKKMREQYEIPENKEKKKRDERDRYAANPEPKKTARQERYAANPEAERKAERKRYATNPEPQLKAKKERYAANPEPKRKAKRERYATDPEPQLKARKERYAANPEPERRAQRERYATNPEPQLKAKRELYAANPEPKRKAEKNRYATQFSQINLAKREKYAANPEEKKAAERQRYAQKQASKEHQTGNQVDKFQKLLQKARKNVSQLPVLACTVCHRIRYREQVLLCNRSKYTSDIPMIQQCLTGEFIHACPEQCDLQNSEYHELLKKEWICHTCHSTLKRGKMPVQAAINGLKVEEVSHELKALNPLERHLIALVQAFIKIIPLPRGGQMGIKGQLVCVPADLQQTADSLPWTPNVEHLIRVKLKRKVEFKGHHLFMNVSQRKIMDALLKLKEINPLYKDVVLNENWISDIIQRGYQEIVRELHVPTLEEAYQAFIETEQEEMNSMKITLQELPGNVASEYDSFVQGEREIHCHYFAMQQKTEPLFPERNAIWNEDENEIEYKLFHTEDSEPFEVCLDDGDVNEVVEATPVTLTGKTKKTKQQKGSQLDENHRDQNPYNDVEHPFQMVTLQPIDPAVAFCDNDVLSLSPS